MSPKAGDMLLRQVRPIIRAALARGAVRPVGIEDLQELEADALAQAAQMLDSAETAGKEVSPNSIAFYVLQSLRSGRRSCYAGRTDVMSPAAQLDGHVTVMSMDEPFGDEDDEGVEEFNLHMCLAASGEDPASQGSRELDWDKALAGLEHTDLDIVLATAMGTPGLDLGLRYGVSPARVSQRKREIGCRLRESLGDTVLADCIRESAWEGGMRAYREKRACRYA